jgi:uncharacterized protein
MSADTTANALCLECGLCCNGVIFADVQLQPGDDPVLLQTLGLSLLPHRRSKINNQKFQQPCSAYDGCRCRIYVERPEYCRDFECLVLKSVKAGRTKTSAARRLIHTARRRAETVDQLLRELGDQDTQVALSRRFQRMRQRLESVETDGRTAEAFGRLTLAVHELNMLLGEAFYPQPRGG